MATTMIKANLLFMILNLLANITEIKALKNFDCNDNVMLSEIC